jgi:hypothetical protein
MPTPGRIPAMETSGRKEAKGPRRATGRIEQRVETNASRNDDFMDSSYGSTDKSSVGYSVNRFLD